MCPIAFILKRYILTKCIGLTLTVSCGEDNLAPGHGAEADRQGGELDHDEPPDGEGEGQPDSHSVDHDGEVGVEEHEDAPGQGVLLLGVPVLRVQQVHVDGEGDVLEHDEAVGHSDAGQDHVDRVAHVPVGQHHHVGHVEEGPEHAHPHGQVAVHRVVKLLMTFN